jgi:hypothetical protein
MLSERLSLSLDVQQGCSSVLTELNDEVEVVDDDVAILGEIAEEFTISEIKSDVVDGGDEITDPVGRSLDESVQEVHGFTEILWEDSSES